MWNSIKHELITDLMESNDYLLTDTVNHQMDETLDISVNHQIKKRFIPICICIFKLN